MLLGFRTPSRVRRGKNVVKKRKVRKNGEGQGKVARFCLVSTGAEI